MASLHARLQEAGATPSAPHDRPRIARFDDIPAEHARLAEAAALLDDTDRGLIEVTGRRAGDMLAGLLTNDLGPLESRRAVYGFFLTAKGRPVAEARVLPREEGAWLDVPAACLEGLLEHLERTLPPLYARFAPRQDVVRLAVVGPRAAEALGAWPEGPGPEAARLPPLGTARPPGPEAAEADAPWWLAVSREPVEGPGFDLYVPAEGLQRAWTGLARAVETVDGGPAGREAYHIWRIERGVPAFGTDIGPGNLPQETGQEERALSFSKGCYTGQEVVARIHYRGHVNRHLRGLRLEVERPGALEPGRELFREGRRVGEVTSGARSPRFGPIGLGYVRREVEPGDLLATEPGGAPRARVVALPFTSM